jgi:ABC-2 type transport system permease protein
MSNKFWIVARRECMVRMSKRSFWLLALLGPLALLIMSVVPYAISSGMKDEKKLLINVPNECFDQFPLSIGVYKTNIITVNSDEAHAMFLLSDEQVLCDLQTTSDTLWVIHAKEKINVLDSLNLSRVLNNVRVNAFSKPIRTQFSKTELPISSSAPSALQQTIAMVASLLVYMFLFTYSASLLKGVMEEKSNKVMDIILSSVSPFTWLMGKITGVGLASVVQFCVWMFVSYVPYYFFQQHYGKALDMFSPEQIQATIQSSSDPSQALAWSEWLNAVHGISWWSLMLIMFACMSLGFILYAAIFSVVGILADRESDTQPYILPITSPLLLAFFTSGVVMAEPYGNLAMWFSYIPFTAPIILPIRLALGVAWYELILPLVVMFSVSFGVLFFAGKLYKRVLNRG